MRYPFENQNNSFKEVKTEKLNNPPNKNQIQV